MFESEPISPKRRVGRVAHIGVLIGVIAIAAAGAFAYKSIRDEKGGGDSPVASAQRFFDALENEDVLGILEALPPSERNVLSGSIVDIAHELSRLHILSDDVDLSGIRGLDLSFEGLRFASTPLTDRLAIVRVVAGRGRMVVQPRQLPLGSFVRDLAGPALDEQPLPDVENLANTDAKAAAVREGGHWYISILYSAAEAARQEAGVPLPREDQRVEAKGAATPEAAVEDLVRALARFDVRRAIELMPPDELRVLHDYSALFIDEAENAAAEARRNVETEITKLDLSSTRSRDEARVKIEDFALRADSNDGAFAVSFDGKCAHISGPEVEQFLPPTICNGGQVPSLFFGVRVPELTRQQPDLAFVAVQRGGAWYVSPARTILRAFVDVLKALEPRDLEAMRDFFREL